MTHIKQTVKSIGAIVAGILIASLALSCGAKAEKVKEIQFSFWGDQATVAIQTKIVAEFSKQFPQYRVKLMSMPYAKHHEKFMSMAASGSTPDLVWVDSYYFPEYVRKDIFTDLTEWVTRDKADLQLEDIYPSFLEETKYDAKQWGLPFAGGSSVIAINKTLFEKRGVALPSEKWNWDDFQKIARRLTHRESSEKFSYGFKNMGFIIPFSLPWLNANGANLFNEDRSKCTLNTPQALETFNFLHSLTFKDNVSPTFTSTDTDELDLTGTGAFGMIEIIRASVPHYRTYTWEWDVTTHPYSPKGNRSAMIKANVMVIPKAGKNKEGAWELMKFLSTAKTEKRFISLGRFFPQRISNNPALLESTPPNNNHAFFEAMKYGNTMQLIPKWFEMTTIVHQEFDEMIQTKGMVIEAVSKIEKRVNDLLASE